jgi:hypothetical protein
LSCASFIKWLSQRFADFRRWTTNFRLAYPGFIRQCPQEGIAPSSCEDSYEDIGASPAVEAVVARAAVEAVFFVAAVEDVGAIYQQPVSASTVQVATTQAKDAVVTAKAEDDIIAGRPRYDIVAGGTHTNTEHTIHATTNSRGKPKTGLGLRRPDYSQSEERRPDHRDHECFIATPQGSPRSSRRSRPRVHAAFKSVRAIDIGKRIVAGLAFAYYYQ